MKINKHELSNKLYKIGEFIFPFFVFHLYLLYTILCFVMKKLELNDKQKRKNMIDLFKLSVENSKNNFNTPDEIFFCGYQDYMQDNAIPFVYLRFRNENKLFYGEPGTIHDKLRPEVQGYLTNRGYKPSDITGYKRDDEYINQDYYKTGNYLNFADEEFVIKGRYFIIDVPYINQNCVVFGFWYMNRYPMELTNEIVYQVCKDNHLFNRRIFIINGSRPLIEYNSFAPGDEDIEDNTEQGILHMLPGSKKWKETAGFRNMRDKQLGKKLTMSNGKEMPMAQYNALRYVDENMINESVDKSIEEKVRKAVRDMIKDGELPKYYGKDKAPLEMAEHYAHILKKIFGDDYKIYHTQSMEDDDICCAVIDDEFKKNGGHYDMDDCENHLESVKKRLDKIIKEEYSMISTKKIYLTESQLSYIKKELEKARKETNTNPTEGQKEAGNYKMGRVNIYGFEIAIENPKGSYRKGKDKDGKEWKCLMHNDYGYFTHTKAVDGDAVDVFLGKDLDCKTIFAIDQVINGKFDETKIMFGFKTEEEAKKAYLSNYNKGWKGLGKVTEVSIDDFKEWLYDGYKQRKPFSEYNEIKKKKLNENVDFAKKEKLLLGDDGDYAHIFDKTFDDIISEYENKNTTPFLTRESIDEIVDDNEMGDVLHSFDIQKQLNPKFWINGKLNSRVRLRLLDIADTFFDSLGVDWVKPKDIIMTGSLANYNWSKFSDIDLHIVVDFTEVDERVDFVKNYFDSKKKIWNEEHEDLKIYGYPVELYVQDENEEHTASGVYSLEKDKWLREPEEDNLRAVKLDKETVVDKTKKIADKIENLESACNNEKDVEKLDILSGKVKSLFDKIKGMRKDALKNGTEMSTGNVIFKCLRRLGYIGRLVDLKSLTFDKINSIK